MNFVAELGLKVDPKQLPKMDGLPYIIVVSFWVWCKVDTSNRHFCYSVWILY